MIAPAFILLKNQLAAYIASLNDGGSEQDVVLGNVAALDNTDASADMEKRLILSLVNIEEESTLKNTPNFTRSLTGITYRNAPVFLNLYMLVTAHFDSYESALERLSNTIQFFQSKSSFTLLNAPADSLLQDSHFTAGVYDDMQVHLELFSLSFEQLNHLWGSLGGKQWPSVLYKVRLVRIEENRTNANGTLIETIQGNTFSTVIQQPR